jgi:hypothetical protein
VVFGLTCDFWAENAEKIKTTAKTKAIIQSLRPSGFAPAFGRAVGRFAAGIDAGLKEGAEKVPHETKIVPQRLKAHCEQCTCGTAEAVPLSKTDFFSTL